MTKQLVKNNHFLTVTKTKLRRPLKTSVYEVDQCLTIFISSTLRFFFVQVKLVKSPKTWSCVFRSPAMN